MLTRSFIVALAALALAACGGGGGGGDGGDGAGGGDGGIDTTNTIYQAGFSVCSSASPQDLKNEYIAPSTDPEDIAERVGVSLASDATQTPLGRQGCLDGMKARAGE